MAFIARKGFQASLKPFRTTNATDKAVAFILFVIPLGFEPKTHSLEGCCSIQLSYGTILIWGCKDSNFF